MYWKESTREHAALQLLSVSHRLSVGAHIFRPIELQVQQQAKADLVIVLDELSRLGYAKDCSPSTAISSALSTLEAHSEGTPLPFTTALHISQLLLQSVQFLSPSPSPFPVPNRHLPPEILHLIYGFLLDEEPAAVRQKAIVALSATSVLWRQIVNERPVIYLDSLQKLAKYSKLRQDWITSDPTRWERSWKEVEIDLSGEELPELTVEGVAREITAAEMGKRFWHKGKLLLNLNTMGSPIFRQVLDELMASLGEWKHFTLKIMGNEESHYWQAGSGFEPGCLKEDEVREFYIGDPDEPVELESRMTYQLFREAYEFYESWTDGDEDQGSQVAVLTNYTLLAAPWLTFNTLSLIFGMVGKMDATDLPTSPLHHLELSYEVDGSDPADAPLEIQVLFTIISPNIEYLSLRLRLSSPHPSVADEEHFTVHLCALLTRCKRLRHLEIGGFGFSLKLITYLFTLPLESLVLLPLQHVPPPHMIPDYFSFAPTLFKPLKSLKKFGIDSRLISECDWENVITASHENGMVGLQLVRENRAKENDLLRTLMRRVGIS